jgi:hypothetical protein
VVVQPHVGSQQLDGLREYMPGHQDIHDDNLLCCFPDIAQSTPGPSK